MITPTRRAFLGGMSGSMLAVGLGSSLLGRAGYALGLEEAALDALDFGELEPLATLIQETLPEELQRALIGRIRGGAELHTLVAAAALANARTFGGQDYVGYHCQMALVPALEMSKLLPAARKPLPVLKVLYRTANRIQECGGRSNEALHALPEAAPARREESAARLREAFLKRDLEGAERAFSELSRNGSAAAFDALQTILQENLDVHRVVLAWRAWEGMQLTGERHAETLLRQSVRFCVDAEKERRRRGRPEPELRSLLPELLDEHELADGSRETRSASDEEVEELALGIFRADKADAASTVADALGSGLARADVGEALSLAANHILMHDQGRSRANASREKPIGSVHGASPGVHASDAARAWRNIAAVTGGRNAAASLIAGAYHTAGQSGYVGKRPFAFRERMDEVGGTRDGEELLRAACEALEAGDQELTCAAVHRYGEMGASAGPLFDALLAYGTSQDGALHAEKYFYTVREEFADARPAFRWRHLVALARVTASEYGFPAPGYESALEELGV
ncbi:MAG: hypothetical protein O7B99_11660 [Planctomycetota bacterium]|nr:hypothetical protein [Planctomycetota bacterium]